MTYQRTPGLGISYVPITSLVSGRYYGPTGATGPTTRLTASGTMYASALVVNIPITITRIGAEVSSAGAASSTVRLGIYPDVAGVPSGLPILDAGTIAGDSATVQEITISQALLPGIYWLALKAESAGTYPTMRALSSTIANIGTAALATALGATIGGYAPTGVAAGALVAFPASPVTLTSIPSVAVKIA